jgi:hypothetical protein
VELGTENRNKVIIAAVLIVVAVIALGRLLFTGSAPAAASPASHPAAQAVAPETTLAPVAKRGTRLQPSLDPSLRFDWLRASEDVKYEGRGRNIFRAEAEPVFPTPIAPGVTDKTPPAVVEQGPPPPPPIRLKFYGFANTQGAAKKVFLSDEGGDIFVAGEGDIVDRQYRILRISPMSVEVEDVLNNNRQQIPLTQG